MTWRPFEPSREAVKAAQRHPDRERRRSQHGPGEEHCTWCHGGGTIRSSIDIRQPECPCVRELDWLGVPEYVES